MDIPDLAKTLVRVPLSMLMIGIILSQPRFADKSKSSSLRISDYNPEPGNLAE